MLNPLKKNATQKPLIPEEHLMPQSSDTDDPVSGCSPAYTASRSVTLNRDLLEKNRIVAMQSGRPETESFKLLRTRILHRMRENGWTTLMITSPAAGDGKTTVAINLAITFAREYNHTAILVDGDLRQQAVHKQMGYSASLGLADYLLNDRPMCDLIVWPGIEKLTVISGGRTIQNSTELLGSKQMKSLVDEMKSRYADRFIFFDVPPLLTVADAVAFSPMVDAVLMVIREGHTRMPDIDRALELVPSDKFLGYVMNASMG